MIISQAHQLIGLTSSLNQAIKAPRELIIDFDATDNRVHGMQEGRFFHGYYGDWCFLPLYVFLER